MKRSCYKQESSWKSPAAASGMGELEAARSEASPDVQGDSLLAVDRRGRVLALRGDILTTPAWRPGEGELGGFPSVVDALHGYERDDSLALGDTLFLLVVVPVLGQPSEAPVGALVALRRVAPPFAKELANAVHAPFAFFTGGRTVASNESYDLAYAPFLFLLDDVEATPDYQQRGRSPARTLEGSGSVLFSRIAGESWLQPKTGYMVVVPVAGR
jgi:hypothetical protein